MSRKSLDQYFDVRQSSKGFSLLGGQLHKNEVTHPRPHLDIQPRPMR